MYDSCVCCVPYVVEERFIYYSGMEFWLMFYIDERDNNSGKIDRSEVGSNERYVIKEI